MDVLNDVFSQMQLSGVHHLQLEIRGPWGLAFQAQNVVKLGLVVEGSILLTHEGSAKGILLGEGDFFLCTNQAAYTLQDHPNSRVIDLRTVLTPHQANLVDPIRLGQEGPRTRLLLGMLTFDNWVGQHLMEALPPFILWSHDEQQAADFGRVLEQIVAESVGRSPGASLVTQWLGSILFLQAVRQFGLSSQNQRPGWLAALKDQAISRSLQAFHAEVGHGWTIELLAKEAGLSRSGFALRFHHVMGCTPLEYLTRWRMTLATSLLRQGDEKTDNIARRLGYLSVSSFSRVFQQRWGQTPAQFRRFAI